MKKLALKTLRQVGYVAWSRNCRDYLAVFNYHQATAIRDPRYHSAETWTCLDFLEQELHWIQSHFVVLPLTEAIARHRSGRLRGATAALTFDDGDVSVERYVLPLLSRLGLPATLFINSAYLSGKSQYWYRVLTYLANSSKAHDRDRLPAEVFARGSELRLTRDPDFYQRTREEIEQIGETTEYDDRWCVSEQCLAELDSQQFHIGLHGHEHQRFSMMSVDWQLQSLKRNIDILSRFPAYRPIFALPFGRPIDFGPEIVRIALQNNLDILAADGGLNLHPEILWKRIPADQTAIKDSLRREALGW